MRDQHILRDCRIVLLGLAWIVLAGCEKNPDDPLTTEKAVEELQATYDELIAKGVDVPLQWATDDIENIGDWEYRILDLADNGADSLQETLNELGNERWEVFWIENVRNDYRVMLKRPSKSYLNRIPLSQIGQFVIGGSGDEQ